MENVKKKYDAPEIEVVRFDSEDVITASGDGKLGHSGYMMPRIF